MRHPTAERDRPVADGDPEVDDRSSVWARVGRDERLRTLAERAFHDLHGPARRVTAFARLLDARVGARLQDDERELLGYLAGAGRRLQDLLEGLAAYLRIATDPGGDRHPLDLRALWEQIVATRVDAIVPREAAIRAGELPWLRVDGESLRRVLAALLDNALRFASERPLSVSLTSRELPTSWELCVSDNGVGIAAEDRERVFEPLVRIDRSEDDPGLGLGLPICRELVRRLGGRIWVTSAEGGGTAVYFTVSKSDA